MFLQLSGARLGEGHLRVPARRLPGSPVPHSCTSRAQDAYRAPEETHVPGLEPTCASDVQERDGLEYDKSVLPLAMYPRDVSSLLSQDEVDVRVEHAGERARRPRRARDRVPATGRMRRPNWRNMTRKPALSRISDDIGSGPRTCESSRARRRARPARQRMYRGDEGERRRARSAIVSAGGQDTSRLDAATDTALVCADDELAFGG